MFCRLFDFENDTGIKIVDTQKCESAICDYYNGKFCDVYQDLSESLFTKEKYNWNIVRKIQMKGFDILEDEETLQAAIKLMHPKNESVWIAQWISKNKSGETIYSFSILISGSETKCDSLFLVNFNLKKNISYEGRKIDLQDFIIER